MDLREAAPSTSRMSAAMVHHALLLAVDCYMPNRLPSGESYPSLEGCVRDVELLAGFLRKGLGIPDERITKLTASGGGMRPVEPPERWPTYENIVAAFERVTAVASPGDRVHIHYSGHGGRARTIFPKAKEAEGIDEALVPTDIGSNEGRYLRDLELAKLLGRMVDKGLLVSVTLDCCHSGGMTRTGGAKKRGILGTDPRVPTEGSSLVTDEEAVSMLEGRAAATRNIGGVAGLLPDPKGYTVLAACLKTESAYEAMFDGRPHGALTYWLVQLLPQLGTELTYRALCDQLVARVHSQFPAQTPVVMGEVDRVVFGVQRRRVSYTAKVLAEDADRGARIDVGQAHGVTNGARFVVFPPGTEAFDEREEQVAELEVRDVGATESWADVIARTGGGVIEPGAPAVLVGAPKARFVRKVGLVGLEGHPLRAGLEAAVRSAGWVKPAGEGETADFQVGVDARGCFEILDSAGEAVPWLRPEIQATEPGATGRTVERLEHLARFRGVMQLANHDARSPLARGLELRLLGWAREHDPCEPFEPERAFEGPAELRVGMWTALRVRNASRVALNVCLFDLQPDWGVTLVWPGDGAGFRTLDPGEEEVVALRVSLPEGYEDGVDVLKVFATVGATDFRWLELPALDRPVRRRSVGREPEGELEKLLAMVGRGRPKQRHAWGCGGSGEWVTGQVELRVRRTGSFT